MNSTPETDRIVPVKTYVFVFVALILLAALTTGLAYVKMGIGNTIAALAIAVIKAALVVLFFMHAFYDRGLTRVVFVAGILWLSILIVLSATDVFTRHWTPIPHGWAQDSSLPRR